MVQITPQFNCPYANNDYSLDEKGKCSNHRIDTNTGQVVCYGQHNTNCLNRDYLEGKHLEDSESDEQTQPKLSESVEPRRKIRPLVHMGHPDAGKPHIIG